MTSPIIPPIKLGDGEVSLGRVIRFVAGIVTVLHAVFAVDDPITKGLELSVGVLLIDVTLFKAWKNGRRP